MTSPLDFRSLSPRLACLAKSLVLVLTFAFVGSAQASNRPRPARRASLVWLLASYQVELKRTDLDQFGPDTVELLIDIANTPRDAAKVRVRALAGLGLYPSEDSYAFLTSLLNERNLIGNFDGLQMRRQAIRSLGRGFGERAIDELMTFKNDEQPAVRQAVAQALGDSGSQRALPTLELWLDNEQDITVKIAVDRAVNQLRGR